MHLNYLRANHCVEDCVRIITRYTKPSLVHLVDLLTLAIKSIRYTFILVSVSSWSCVVRFSVIFGCGELAVDMAHEEWIDITLFALFRCLTSSRMCLRLFVFMCACCTGFLRVLHEMVIWVERLILVSLMSVTCLGEGAVCADIKREATF